MENKKEDYKTTDSNWFNSRNEITKTQPGPTVRWKKLTQGAKIPEYKSKKAAGMDITSIDNVTIPAPNLQNDYKPSTVIVATGLAMALPEGYEAQIRPRSGLAAKHGITVLNSPGTIDSDFRGEIKVILTNLGKYDFKIEPGDRIAQVVIAKCEHVRNEVVSELDETERGTGGFGSTGMK